MKMKPLKAILLLLIWGTATCAMELTQEDLQRKLLAAVALNNVKEAAFYLSCGANPQTPSGQKGWTTLTYLRAITDFFSRPVNNYEALLTQAREEGYDPEPYEQDSGAQMLELLKQRHPTLELPQTNPNYFSYRELTQPGRMSLAAYPRAASLLASLIFPSQVRDGARSFIASQIEGTRQLLAFGRSAGEALLSQTAQSYYASADGASEAVPAIPADDLIAKLVHNFLQNPETYKQSVAIFPPDLRKLLARALLSGHTIKNFLKKQLELRACIDTIITTPGVLTVYRFNVKKEQTARQENDNTHNNQTESCLVISHACSGIPVCTLRHPSLPQANDPNEFFVGVNDERFTVFNHDRTRVATFSGRGGIRTSKPHKCRAVLWDTASGSSLHVLQGHTRKVKGVQFSPDGKSVLTTSYDNTVKIWDVESGECLQTLAQDDFLYVAFFHPFDNIKIVTTHGRYASVWDSKSGRCIVTLEGHTGEVYFAQYNKAGDKIVTASRQMALKIWNASTGECLHTLANRTLSTRHAQFNRAGDRIISVDDYNEAKVWDVGKLFGLTKWLESCSLEHALLLHCIYETWVQKILLKRLGWVTLLQSGPRFDFNYCPNLQEVFDSIPAELQIQEILAPYVIRCLREESDFIEIEDEL